MNIVRDFMVDMPHWKLCAMMVQYEDRALDLGHARNTCLDGLTGNSTPVTDEEQIKWFRSWKPLRHIAYLYYDWSLTHLPVGWSHIYWDEENFAWPSLGVVPSARGRGYGKEIVEHTMIACGGPALGLMRKDNKTIQKIDFDRGWEIVGDYADDTYEVRYPWPPKFLKETI